MTRIVKKTLGVIALLIFILPVAFNYQNFESTEGWVPEFWIAGYTQNPQYPHTDDVVTITTQVFLTGGSYLSVTLYYRINGDDGTLVTKGMTSIGNDQYRTTIPVFSAGTEVEYKIRATAEILGYLETLYSPYSGYHSYTVTEPSDIAWISPSAGMEITFGPVGDDITFNFDWSMDNLDDARLSIGSQEFDILDVGSIQVKSVVLDGAALDGITISATLKGYNNAVLAASASRSFSFRRLDYELSWNSPSDGNTIAFSPTGLAKFNFTFTQGVDIDYVNLFFNNSFQAEVTSPWTHAFTFGPYEGVIEATLEGYDSGDNLIATDTRSFIFRRLVFEVVWDSPAANSSITFGPGTDPELFNITFSKGTDVNFVKLSLNGLDMGNVSSPATVSFLYSNDTHGLIEAVLTGYNAVGSLLSSDTRNFTFDKIVDVRYEILQQNEINLGQKLYLILHDPNGDNSFSSYEQSTSISLGVGCEFKSSNATGIEIGVEQEVDFFGLFESGIEASTKLALSKESSQGFEIRYDITDSTFLSSSDSSSNIDFIGPGYGDRYWGELWKLKYVFTIHYHKYFNTSEVYFDPHLWWGILRDAEAYLSDATAPESWRAQNPVNQGYSEEAVEWVGGTFIADGGGTYTNTHEISNTNTLSESITIGLETETKAKLSAGGAYVEGSLELSLETKVYAEMSIGNTITTSYTIKDADPTDSIVQKVGIDKNFGTYIFQTVTDFCKTSSPIEHGTLDYLPPVIGYPTIIYDTDQDFKGPTPQDNPLVTVKIEEEGGMQTATLYYSIDNGTSWRMTPLVEYPGQPDVWHANIPKQANNTVVLWYLEAIDDTGNSALKFDITDSYFSYKVGIIINPLEAQTPGFTFWTVFLTFALGAFLISKRRH